MINLLFCSNAAGFNGILINLLSLVRHSDCAVHAFILTMDLRSLDPKHCPVTEKMRCILETVVKEKNVQSRVRLLDETSLFLEKVADGNPNMDSFYTPYCMLRLIAELVPELPGKILYLDTDTVFFGDVEELYGLDITNYELAAAEDYLGRWFKYIGYINSGVLLLNLVKIRETGLLGKTRDGCRERRSWFPDQDALNKHLRLRLMLPARFNEQRRLKSDTVVLHFCKSIRWLPYYHTVNVKPWQIQQVREVLKITVLDDVLNEYLTLKDRVN